MLAAWKKLQRCFRSYLQAVPHDGVATYSLAVIMMQQGQKALLRWTCWPRLWL